MQGRSHRWLADEYHVDKRVIGRIIVRGRYRDFSVHDSTNHRYHTIGCGLKKLMKTEEKIKKRIERLDIKRYEKAYPGEMVHADTKLLPRIKGETKKDHRERLYVVIDKWTVCHVISKSGIRTEVQNGRVLTHMHLCSGCKEQNITQYYTKPRTPQTNSKAERVIRTLMEQWHRTTRFLSKRDRRFSLYAFVDYYNHVRKHGSIQSTP